MTIKILTLFPEMFSVLNYSILGKAIATGKILVEAIDIRPYSLDKKHFKCDDMPFGGGAGMVMSVEPIYNAIEAIDPKREYHRIYLSPKGEALTTKVAQHIAKRHGKLILLCGRYEGVDQRVIDLCIDQEISIGDYVLTGGELGAMVLVDAVSRYVHGVLGNNESAIDESFSDNLLEYPHYTRPAEFKGLTVPDVLISGHHKKVADWRKEQSLIITKERRPDLLK